MRVLARGYVCVRAARARAGVRAARARAGVRAMCVCVGGGVPAAG